MALCDSHSGFLWLELTLSGFHWFSLALSGSFPLSLWLSMALCDSYSGSHWLSLPFSGILWPSLAHYCSLILRIQALIGSQGPCSTLNAAATLTHFLPLCRAVRLCREKKLQIVFFCQTSRSSGKYLPNICDHLFHQTDIWRGFFSAMFNWSSTYLLRHVSFLIELPSP